MPQKRYHVRLTAKERGQLLTTLRRGRQSARTLTRARILLLADDQHSDDEIADSLHVGRVTVYRVRKRYVQAGLAGALCEKPRPGAPPKVSSRLEAQLTALACSQPPEGRGRWTLRLLADKVVELDFVQAISHTTIRRVLKKTHSNHG
jgi:putative transposase